MGIMCLLVEAGQELWICETLDPRLFYVGIRIVLM